MKHDETHQRNGENNSSGAVNVPIINHCHNTYRLHPENILAHTLTKIPEKFLAGLREIHLFDARPNTHLRKSSVCKSVSPRHSAIEIYMDDPIFRRTSFSSIMQFNMIFFFAFNEHIRQNIQPYSDDQEILSYNPSKINLRWGYFGRWTPILSLIKIVQALILGVPLLYKGWGAITNRFIEKQAASRHDKDVSE